MVKIKSGQLQVLQHKKEFVLCEYLNGETCQPPEDVGGPDDWYRCMLLCHGISFKRIGKSFGVPHLLGNWCRNKRDFYEWIKEGRGEYYDIICLANKERYLAYFGMNKH
eukprot:UN12158